MYKCTRYLHVTPFKYPFDAIRRDIYNVVLWMYKERGNNLWRVLCFGEQLMKDVFCMPFVLLYLSSICFTYLPTTRQKPFKLFISKALFNVWPFFGINRLKGVELKLKEKYLNCSFELYCRYICIIKRSFSLLQERNGINPIFLIDTH